MAVDLMAVSLTALILMAVIKEKASEEAPAISPEWEADQLTAG
jgi:hypothetical protein